MVLGDFIRRLVRLLWGLFLYALGISLTVNAHIGYAPWDTFHAGIANVANISFGTASIVVGLVIIAITLLLQEKIGLGSILNMFAIGFFLDVILGLEILPVARNFLTGLFMLIMGLFVIALGSYFYMDSGFGAGPRDSLMVALTRRTKLPIGFCRGAIELAALLCGWRLGGMVGLGTVICGLLTGFCVQLTFKLLKFEATGVEHQTLAETFETLRS
jgi:uncharacterized membrane protein YczE